MPEEASQKPVSIADFYSTALTLSAYCAYLEEHMSSHKKAAKIIAVISNSSFGVNQQLNLIYDQLYDELFPYLIRVSLRSRAIASRGFPLFHIT